MERIKDTISAVFDAWTKDKGRAGAAGLERALKKTLTKKELRHIKFNYFCGGILNLNVDSSAWLYHFNLHKQGFLLRLRQAGAPEVKDVRFYIGEIKSG